MCSEDCGLEVRALSVPGQTPPHPDGVIPSMADGSKFIPSHNPSVGKNSGSLVANLICYETAKLLFASKPGDEAISIGKQTVEMRLKVTVIYFIYER